MSSTNTPRRVVAILSSIFALAVIAILQAAGWGWDAHRFINRSSVYYLPDQMVMFISDSAFFALHSPDADQRRVSGDTSFYAEGPRHYLDIDDYPGFEQLSHDLDSLIAQYGWERVKKNGTLPWATVWTYDSLVAQLSRNDWDKALLTASDLGHYVADAHQPLHCTANYNGQLSNNFGIHSRYETEMLSPTYYLSSLVIHPDSSVYVSDRIGYAFAYILHSQSLIDTILHGDTYAKSVSGWGGSGQVPAPYYTALWEKTRDVTLDQMQSATQDLANLWYSAWVDAGLLTPSGVPPGPTHALDFHLEQNYPNPFNGPTNISYRLPVGGTVSLTVFTIEGRKVATVVDEVQSAGDHTVKFDASGLASGAYLYQLRLGRYVQTREFVLLK